MKRIYTGFIHILEKCFFFSKMYLLTDGNEEFEIKLYPAEFLDAFLQHCVLGHITTIHTFWEVVLNCSNKFC